MRQKQQNKEAYKSCNIDISSLTTGSIVGSAVLYDVKLYQNKEEVMADQSKHFAIAAYASSKYGFLLSDAKRFDKPIPMKGQLGLFNVSI